MPDLSMFFAVKPPEFESPGTAAARQIGLRTALQQQSLGAEQLKQAQLQTTAQQVDFDEGQRFKDALANNAGFNDLLKVSPTRAAAWLKSQADLRKSALDAEETQIKNSKGWNEIIGAGAGAVLASPVEVRPQVYAQIRQGLLAKKPDLAVHLPEAYDENAIKAAMQGAMSADQQMTHAAKALEQKRQQTELELNQWKAAVEADTASRNATTGEKNADTQAKQAASTAAYQTGMLKNAQGQLGVAQRRVNEEVRHNRATEPPPFSVDPSTGAPGNGGPGGPGVLANVPGPIADLVKKITAYDVPLPSGMAMRTPYWQRILELATAYDPSFSVSEYANRAALRRDFKSGHSAQAITSFNTAIGHLETLSKAGQALNNSSFTPFNRLANTASSAVGDPRMQRFEVAKNAVADELMKSFRSSGGSEAEAQGWKHVIDSSGSPAQLKAAIDQAVELLGSRIDALKSQYERGMGRKADIDVLTDKSRRILKSLGHELTDETPAPAAPAAPAPAPAAVPALPGVGQTYNGEKVRKVTRVQ